MWCFSSPPSIPSRSELLVFQIEIDSKQEVVVYDQSSKDVTSLSPDCFLTVLLGKLEKNFSSVYLLAGMVLPRKNPKHSNKEKKERCCP